MYGTNGTGSALGASATVVVATTGMLAVTGTDIDLYIKVVAATSYLFLLATIASFMLKRRAARKAAKR